MRWTLSTSPSRRRMSSTTGERRERRRQNTRTQKTTTSSQIDQTESAPHTPSPSASEQWCPAPGVIFFAKKKIKTSNTQQDPRHFVAFFFSPLFSSLASTTRSLLGLRASLSRRSRQKLTLFARFREEEKSMSTPRVRPGLSEKSVPPSPNHIPCLFSYVIYFSCPVFWQ